MVRANGDSIDVFFCCRFGVKYLLVSVVIDTVFSVLVRFGVVGVEDGRGEGDRWLTETGVSAPDASSFRASKRSDLRAFPDILRLMQHKRMPSQELILESQNSELALTETMAAASFLFSFRFDRLANTHLHLRYTQPPTRTHTQATLCRPSSVSS